MEDGSGAKDGIRKDVVVGVGSASAVATAFAATVKAESTRVDVMFDPSIWSLKVMEPLQHRLAVEGYSVAWPHSRRNRQQPVTPSQYPSAHPARVIVARKATDRLLSLAAENSSAIVEFDHRETIGYYPAPDASSGQLSLARKGEISVASYDYEASAPRLDPSGPAQRGSRDSGFDEEEWLTRYIPRDAWPLYDLIALLLADSRAVLEVPTPSVLVDVKLYHDDLILEIAKDYGKFYDLTSRQFEELIARLLERDGFDVTLTKATRDGGIDIFASKPERFGKVLYGYECKRYRPDRPIGVGIVRQFATSVRDNDCVLGVLCSTSAFTADAIETAKPHLIYPQSIKDLHHWVTEVAGLR